jgi:hypothetical protein
VSTVSVRVKGLVIGIVVAVVATMAVYYRNAGVIHQPGASPHGEQAEKVMLITLESGQTVSVSYLFEDGIVYADADADAPWWKGLTGNGDGVTVVMEGETIFARARAVEDDDALRSKMLARLRPNAPSSAGMLIEIKLAPWAFRKKRS